jgi:hypothetical protein
MSSNSKTKKEEMIMITKKSMWVLFGILVISTWVLGSAMQVGAETMNYKFYSWMNKREAVSVDDVEGHIVTLAQRGGFYVLENGEIATIKRVSMNDVIKGADSAVAYETITFADGSTIVLKSQTTLRGAEGTTRSGEYTGEILKGTGRFQGIKGNQTAKAKILPVEKGEAGSRQYGEGTLTYTMPSK